MNAERLRYDSHGHANPIGVRAAAVKMGLILAAETKGSTLTEDDARIVTAAVAFLADEYTRISDDNERLTRELAEAHAANAALLERLRAHGQGEIATDGEME